MRSLVAALVMIATTAAAGQVSAPRFRAGAEVIAIDVTVIDRNGEPVADLTAEDFTVSVEGRPRAIQSTQFLKSDTTLRVTRPDESTNTDAASGRLVMIVTDDATLRPSSHAVVEAAGAVIERLGPGDLVSVTHIPDGGGVPFTADRRRVLDELKRVRPPSARFLSDASVYISEALDFDGSRRVQWPAAVMRECGVEADTPVYRLCVLNIEQTARVLLDDESIKTNATIRGLEALMKSLAPTGRPVTIVFLSESMVIARDPAALVGLAEACAEARVTLHVVQPAPATAEMTARGFPSDPVSDLQLRTEGLQLMAAQARGEFHRVVSTGASTFERIGRETSAYYLLGIEPSEEDRRQPRRRVDVKVRRPGLTVRARSMFALDRRVAEVSTDATARLKQLLDAPVQEKGLPLRITTRTISGEKEQLRVLVAAEIGEATDQRARYHVGLIAIDSEGNVKARMGTTTALAPARNGRMSPSLLTTSLLLEPGDYSLRLAAIDETGRSGSVHHAVRVGMREWPRGFHTSDLIVANQPAGDEFPPFNASSIVVSNAVATVLEVLHDDASALDAAGVRFEVDDVVVESSAAPAVRGAGGYVRSFASLIDVSTGGEHRVKAIVTAPGMEDITIERTFSYEPQQLDPDVTRGFIEMLERRETISPLLAAFVAQAKNGQFVAAPEADRRSDGELAMVTFVGGLAALRDNKPALARVLFQQTLAKSPGFEGARFYLARLK